MFMFVSSRNIRTFTAFSRWSVKWRRRYIHLNQLMHLFRTDSKRSGPLLADGGGALHPVLKRPLKGSHECGKVCLGGCIALVVFSIATGWKKCSTANSHKYSVLFDDVVENVSHRTEHDEQK